MPEKEMFGIHFPMDANSPEFLWSQDEDDVADHKKATFWFKFPEALNLHLVFFLQNQVMEFFTNLGYQVSCGFWNVRAIQPHDFEASSLADDFQHGKQLTDEQLALLSCEHIDFEISKLDEPPVWTEDDIRTISLNAHEFRSVCWGEFNEWKVGDIRIVNRHNSHLHAGVRPLVNEGLKNLSFDGVYKKVVTDFETPIGTSSVVQTTDEDIIFYAQRPGRKGLSRFVIGRRPEVTSQVTLVLKKGTEPNLWVLITAWVGPEAPHEPWDAFAGPNSKEFWSTHAFVSTELYEGQITDICPW